MNPKFNFNNLPASSKESKSDLSESSNKDEYAEGHQNSSSGIQADNSVSKMSLSEIDDFGSDRFKCCVCKKQTDIFSIVNCCYCHKSTCSFCSRTVMIENDETYACVNCHSGKFTRPEGDKGEEKTKHRRSRLNIEKVPEQISEPRRLRYKPSKMTAESILEFKTIFEKSRCHICEEADNRFTFICNNDSCQLSFCKVCMRSFMQSVKELEMIATDYGLNNKWVCPVCKKNCKCSKCYTFIKNAPKKKQTVESVTEPILVEKYVYVLPRKRKMSKNIYEFALPKSEASACSFFNFNQTIVFEAKDENLKMEKTLVLSDKLNPQTLLSKKRQRVDNSEDNYCKKCCYCVRSVSSEVSILVSRSVHSFINDLLEFFKRTHLNSINFAVNRKFFKDNVEIFRKLGGTFDKKFKICEDCLIKKCCQPTVIFRRCLFQVLFQKKTASVVKDMAEIMDYVCVEAKSNLFSCVIDEVNVKLQEEYKHRYSTEFFRYAQTILNNNKTKQVTLCKKSFAVVDRLIADSFAQLAVNNLIDEKFDTLASNVRNALFCDNIILLMKTEVRQFALDYIHESIFEMSMKIITNISNCIEREDIRQIIHSTKYILNYKKQLEELRNLINIFLESSESTVRSWEMEQNIGRILSFVRNERSTIRKPYVVKSVQMLREVRPRPIDYRQIGPQLGVGIGYAAPINNGHVGYPNVSWNAHNNILHWQNPFIN